ncbi:MAG: 27 kDa antigen Cfp30B [Syntrophorhabdaceae bacterium PtaU1.Bin034]|nr:MAG: 27 kDa antigen Cfp30B [Syntrophorhabdaceae bacterium PtaU1.Bin034]
MDDRFKRQGMFSWHELMTDDVEGAKKFYTELLGWTVQEFPMEEGETYWVLKVGEEGVGGIMKTPPSAEGVPPHWGVYITVDDVDATAKKAEQLGAKLLVPPMGIPKVGRFAVLQDPRGAAFAVIAYTIEM